MCKHWGNPECVMDMEYGYGVVCGVSHYQQGRLSDKSLHGPSMYHLIFTEAYFQDWGDDV